ncbi:MAG: class 1 isoprenoid biosynthesis enzyme [Lachnospiraceae bacterium]|nr:class 1 isoprenoid biosynthesis enzyme [Lachnospiraceae bacterium]
MPDTFPDFLQTFSPEERIANDKFVDKLRDTMRSLPQNPSIEQKEEMKKKMFKMLEEENILHIKKHISADLFQEFEENIENFVEKAKAFDETLSMENIWQAMRNYLIYAMIVNLQGKCQNCRDTILGYSLLYPYTDNYIDELHRTDTDKNSYNNLIRKTLSGEETYPQNDYEEKTKQLLKLVLNHYSDDADRQKDASFLLLLMLEAQEKSILQIHRFGTKKLTKEEILRISIYKGGLSVFLDYMFSMDFDLSSITEEERFFYLCFGLILQLADDLQDIAEDKKKHSRTLFTICRHKKNFIETMQC